MATCTFPSQSEGRCSTTNAAGFVVGGGGVRKILWLSESSMSAGALRLESLAVRR